MTLQALIQDLRLNPEHCPKEVIFKAATALEILASMANPSLEKRNFCPRCGKRLASGFVEISIHTCTPPAP